jgi:hypothetical protein
MALEGNNVVAFPGRGRLVSPAPHTASVESDGPFLSPALDPQLPEQTPAESNGTDLERGTGRQWFLFGAIVAILLGG